MTAPTLAIDFGTSNSAVAIVENGVLRRLPIEDGADTLPTAVFFPADRGEMVIGAAAAEALIAGDEGRYMRALKSVLGTSLFHEQRPIGGQRRTLADIVTAFLVEVKTRAEVQIGQTCTRVLSGRPVRFHSADAERDQKAEDDLRACYHAAGFNDVEFMFEPEAAAWASRAFGGVGQTGLIVDIGGGTSDFSVFQSDDDRLDILHSHGIRLGGTDFDHAISMAHAMPYFGYGGELRRTFGDGLLPVPKSLYVDLSTWAKIPFLYTRETLRLIEDMQRHAVDSDAMDRLHAVIEDQLGHEIAFAVEAGKIAANSGERSAKIDLGSVEKGLTVPISAGSMGDALSEFQMQLREAIYATIFGAGLTPDKITSVVLVGGSSLMNLVQSEARAACPMARINRNEAFTAVVDGLALASVG